MLCKVSAKNQITLPKELLKDFPDREYFDARIEGGKIILEPVIVRPIEPKRLGEIRDRIRDSGIREEDVPLLVAECRHGYGT